MPDGKKNLKKIWLNFWLSYLCTPLGKNGPLVKGLRHLPFTEESRVRISYGLQNRHINVAVFFSHNNKYKSSIQVSLNF
jgi:hypothetical protein